MFSRSRLSYSESIGRGFWRGSVSRPSQESKEPWQRIPPEFQLAATMVGHFHMNIPLITVEELKRLEDEINLELRRLVRDGGNHPVHPLITCVDIVMCAFYHYISNTVPANAALPGDGQAQTQRRVEPPPKVADEEKPAKTGFALSDDEQKVIMCDMQHEINKWRYRLYLSDDRLRKEKAEKERALERVESLEKKLLKTEEELRSLKEEKNELVENIRKRANDTPLDWTPGNNSVGETDSSDVQQESDSQRESPIPWDFKPKKSRKLGD